MDAGAPYRQRPELPAEPGRDFDPNKDELLTIGDEAARVFARYNCGGVLLIVSKQAFSWKIVIPRWSGLRLEMLPGGRAQFRLRINSKTPDAQRIADATVGLIVNLRDMANEVGDLFAQQYKHVKRALEASGARVEHRPFGGGHGILDRPKKN